MSKRCFRQRLQTRLSVADANGLPIDSTIDGIGYEKHGIVSFQRIDAAGMTAPGRRRVRTIVAADADARHVVGRNIIAVSRIAISGKGEIDIRRRRVRRVTGKDKQIRSAG